ncbi:MAG: rod shape-determining protein MreC [Epulopiscium sp. Nele67-Bin005]|nr:MAG: rod shape-determining protein MreC [Epulopiscium sp. Nele67-Bin005]
MKLSIKKIKKKFIIIGAATLIGLTAIVTVGRRYEIALVSGLADIVIFPLQKTTNFVTSSVGEITQYFTNVEALISTHDELKKENERLLYENTILDQFSKENYQLKDLLDMKQRFEQYPTEGANVIARDPGNWYNVFTIDKGKFLGVSKEDVILAQGGLVGYVLEVTPFSAKVISIIDSRSYVSAQVVRSGDIGILSGDIELVNEGMAKLEVDIHADIIKGDQIITSYLSDIYPPGIPIGIVDEVVAGSNGLVQYAYIKPFVDFNQLKNVLVIFKEKQSTGED